MLVQSLEQAYEICKAQASVDGAFDEGLMRHWFDTAFELCANMTDLVWPAQEIEDRPLMVNGYGQAILSYRPAGNVEIYDAYRLVMVLPRPLDRTLCAPPSGFCCLCRPWAKYTIGQNGCQLSPSFVQAVARLFAYMVENRGDAELDEHVLARSGAKLFLSNELAYVA